MRIDGGYQINKPIRDMCIFAKQDLAKDPPFSNLDLITCRNVLIYLGPALQKRVISAMHYGLKPNGYLLLGGSEALGAFADHFELIDKKHKIYQKKKSAARLVTYFSATDYAPRRLDEITPAKPAETVFTVEKEVERLLVNRYVPASIVVNDQMEIVQIHGRTGDYLEPAAGHPTFSLSKMAREGLLVDLRSAVNKAKNQNAPVRKEGVLVKSNGDRRLVDLEVIPIRAQGSNERFCVIVFQEPGRETTPPVEKARRRGGKGRAKENAIYRENERLSREVTQLKEQLQPLIEEHETTLEEFKSANEEVLSANEELQSTNEELETAKEELQSSNEELTTLNEELQNRNAELTSANNDLLNLLANVNIPVVMIGNDLRIRRYTPPAEKLLNLIPGDVGRRLGEIRPNIDSDDLEHLVRNTIDTATLNEREVRENGGGWHLLRIRPYKTWDSKIDGAVISFQDIDALKRNIEQTQNYANTLFESAREAILLLDANLRVAGANPAFYRTFAETPEGTQGRLIYELGQGQWNIPKLRSLLGEIIGNKSRIDDFELQFDFPGLGKRFMTLNAWRIEPEPGRPLIFLSIEDITDKTNQLNALKRQNALLELARDAILVRDLEGKIQFWNRGAEEIYGWKSEEVIGKLKEHVLRPKFPKPRKEIEADLLRQGYWEGEVLHVRRDGNTRTIQSRWVARDEGGSPVVLEINSDISEKKHSEASLRELSSYLIRLQDEERRRIARELHDSAGQKLAFVKMGLDTLTKRSDLKNHVTALTECVNSVDEAINEIRTHKTWKSPYFVSSRRP
jgi:two-component system CheB/CheR fusion protein